MRWRRSLPALSAPLLVVALAGCSTPSWLCYFPSGVSRVTLITGPDTNDERAIAVDLVYVTGRPAADQIVKLSARDWFIQRNQIRRDFPDSVGVRSWELAPGQVVRDERVNPPCNLVQTLLFADYAMPGDHRAQLGTTSAVTVTLGPKDFVLSR